MTKRVAAFCAALLSFVVFLIVALWGATFGIDGNTTRALVPGSTAPINVRISNPHFYPITVSNLAVRIVSITPAHKGAKCSPSNFTLRQAAGCPRAIAFQLRQHVRERVPQCKKRFSPYDRNRWDKLLPQRLRSLSPDGIEWRDPGMIGQLLVKDEGAAAVLVDRTLKGDRLQQNVLGTSGPVSSSPTGSLTRKVPLGCDHAFSPAADPVHAHVFGRCVA